MPKPARSTVLPLAEDQEIPTRGSKLVALLRRKLPLPVGVQFQGFSTWLSAYSVIGIYGIRTSYLGAGSANSAKHVYNLIAAFAHQAVGGEIIIPEVIVHVGWGREVLVAQS